MNGESKFKRLLKSRKFWAAVISIVSVLGAYYTDQSASLDVGKIVDAIVTIGAVYIGSVALEDGLSKSFLIDKAREEDVNWNS